MARLNLEYKLLSDPRFKALSRKLGERLAIGEWVAVAMAAQEYWAKDKALIPPDIWDLNEFSEDLLRCHLVEKKENGYYLKGSEEYFSWYLKMLEFGKKGVEARKLKAENKAKEQHAVDPTVNTPVDCAVNSPVDCAVDFGQVSEFSENPGIDCTVNSPVDCTVNSPVDCTVNPPTPTPTPYKKNKKESALHETMRRAWNEVARPNGLPSCRAITDKRIKAINQATAKNPDLDWPLFFATLPESRFLMGENDRNWKVDFDFAINSDNINKILEGKYVNTANKKLEEEYKKNNEYFLQDGQITESTTAVNFKEIL